MSRALPASSHLPIQGRVTAILGPTNTGKTHFAIERMLAHKSGMIGLPLRLLAREVYEKIVRLKGAPAVALITGEEKIVPPNARYYVCTVEAMPLDIRTACLVIDEIQLCADPERGHIFTERLLLARGEEETIFLGADTMRGAIQKFIPRAWFITRERFSDLAYTGSKKLTRLPRRSAVVAFTAEDVYSIAELIRRQRGGAAVVLGALSPRTRNAQVALYQSGEVDFLVATDAIGLGLNMDVDHVAFAAREKFDGYTTRSLAPHEAGQIAGRAGRYMNDGTFGTTAEAEPFDADLVARIESHRYDPVRQLQWRNPHLDFNSLNGLLASLDAAPPLKGLSKGRPASDVLSLRLVSAAEDIRDMARHKIGLRLLWDVCQLPDFRKLSVEEHAKLVDTIYRHLMRDPGTLPEDWLARQIDRLDMSEGDVATLSGRLAQIRTWTYAAHRPGWIERAGYWQEKTRGVEGRLSDALHEKLTQRFIDRRTSILLKKLREDDLDDLQLDDSGSVMLAGEMMGKLEGFRFAPDPRAEGVHGRTLRAAALRGLENEFRSRATRLCAAQENEISLSEHGRLWWDGAIVAQLSAGPTALSPIITLLADEQLGGAERQAVQAKLEEWLAGRIEARLQPLLLLQRAIEAKAGTAQALSAPVRGVTYRLCENLGTLERRDSSGDIRQLIRELRPFGVWFGRRTIYIPTLLKPEPARMLFLLQGVFARMDHIPAPPQPGLTSFATDASHNRALLEIAGFKIKAGRAIRLDMLERIEDELDKAAKEDLPFEEAQLKVLSLLGCDRESLDRILTSMGWQKAVLEGEPPKTVLRRAPRPAFKKGHKPAQRKQEKAPAPPPTDSPFAGLAALISK